MQYCQFIIFRVLCVQCRFLHSSTNGHVHWFVIDNTVRQNINGFQQKHGQIAMSKTEGNETHTTIIGQ